MARIVILGGGFGGATLAQRLGRRARRLGLEVTLVDRHNYFVFTPLLVEAGTGALEPRHAVVPLRDFVRGAAVRTAEVVGLDAAARRVTIRGTGKDEDESLAYDHLVVALGSVTKLPPVPGLVEHGFEMKSLTDAVTLRDRAIGLLEQADATADPEARRALLHFVVVGGNFSGVEVAGELLVFVREAARAYPNVRPRECNVTLVEIAERILPALDADLADYALRTLRGRGMRVLLASSVRAVRRDRVDLLDGSSLPTRTVIWCAGIAPNPVIAALGLPTDERGWIRCEPDLRVCGLDGVWALGDAALVPRPGPVPYAATAQLAVRQAALLAENLLHALRGEPLAAREFRSVGALAALGCRTAVAKVLGVKLAGFPAWFLWRTVYLAKMPGWARRVRVALDWAMDLVFPRTVVQLGIHRPPPPTPSSFCGRAIALSAVCCRLSAEPLAERGAGDRVGS
jgi:NADH dehydrogenase